MELVLYKKIILCIVLLIFFILLIMLIKNFFQPFFSIIFLLILTTPIFNLLNKINITNRSINSLISIIFVNIIIFIFIAYCGNFMMIKIKDIVITFHNSVYSKPLNYDSNLLNNLDLNGIVKEIQTYYKDLLSSDILRKGALFTTDSIISYFVGNICCYFILVDKYAILKSTEHIISTKKLDVIKKKYEDIKKMITIEVSLVIATTIETILGLMILDIQNAVFLGVLCGILDILPYVGTVLIFLPLVIFELYSKQYVISTGLVMLYILLQFNRQVMETKFMSSKLQIHPLIMIISLYMGGKIFGIIGLIMGPIYILIAKEIILS